MVVIGACASATPAPSPTPAVELPASITVTLGIFSGRVDPSWDLTQAEVAQVVTAIAALPVASGTPPEGGLGYRGFSLLLGYSDQADKTLTAYRGVVAPPSAGVRSVYLDDGRTIERMLLDLGRPRLEAAVVRAVEADLAVAP
jgi:hypothetical protein